MKIFKNNIITSEKADELILKYYEGETTCDEEDMLRIFLQQKKLPSKYDVEKSIFGYFETKNTVKTPTILLSPMFRSAAAAVIVVLIGFTVYKIIPENQNFAYVDGKKITNIENVTSLAKASLGDVSTENNNVVEEELNQFSNSGFYK